MAEHIARVRAFLEARLADQVPPRVLEAGCGSCSWFDLSNRARVVGIDISAKQLQRNTLIHESVLGDITTHRFEPGSFDIIVCIDVLEHLSRPEAALANFREALAAGGLLILKIPNALSWKGLFTKFTPHGLHVWVYRRFLGRPQAGREDVGPFKTYMRLAISPRNLRRWAGSTGLEVAYQDYYQAWSQARLRAKLGPLDLLVRLLDGMTHLLSGGQMSLVRTEYIIVLRKPAATDS